MNLANLVVVICGASSGIGLTLARILHLYGATVVGVYNKHKMKNEIFDTYKCDVSKEVDVKKLFQYVKDKHEKLDVLVNCAAIDINNDIYKKSMDEFMQVLKVNLGGTFLTCKYASLLMKRGTIINISSTDGIDTYNYLSLDYAASKAGVINLTKNLASRFSNIRVCALAPNWVNTESVLAMNPQYLRAEMDRIGQDKLISKEEVAVKIIEIIINSDYASGSIIRMDGNNE